ncbi:hypothetical protein [Spirosoma foliorum]|uniref:Uncharacterized protein n=1 Tax=Spirosoma foliorum TaxID=2710596 RepID=A0A7G5GRK4_9BACT|nr:hypothetical protein [Spirosoma foliorum]QMW01496.1 hypothetical protein H3H32_26570 [Spirosoma foliorum]
MVTTLIYSYIISAVIGLVCLPKIGNTAFKILAIFWAFSVTIDLGIERFDAGDGRLIRLYYCLYYLIALTVYVYVFNANQTRRSIRYWLQWLSVGLLAIVVSVQILENLQDHTAANTVFIAQAFGVFWVVLPYFSDVLVSRNYIDLFKEPLFLVASALLLYTSGNLIATGFFHQLFAYSKELARHLYKLNYGMNIIMCVLFSAAFIVSTKKTRALSNEY